MAVSVKPNVLQKLSYLTLTTHPIELILIFLILDDEANILGEVI